MQKEYTTSEIVQESKKPYTTPEIIQEEEMLFTKEVWENFSEGNWCFGCTNCNCN